MAIIQCTNCGHIVSDQAHACPKCGTPVSTILKQQEEVTENFEGSTVSEPSEEKKSSTAKILIILAIFIALVVGLWLFFNKNKDSYEISTETTIATEDAENTRVEEIANVHSKDLTFFEVQGKIKSITQYNDSQPLGTLVFNSDGELIEAGGRYPFLSPDQEDYSKPYYTKDKDGYISSYGDSEYRWKYKWRDGRVYSEEFWNCNIDAVIEEEEIYQYDSDGRLVKLGNNTYTYEAFDIYDNWTKRVLRNSVDESSVLQTRTIEYYN